MDQAVSIKNLRLIYDEDKKKGGQLEELFFPDSQRISKKLFLLNLFYKKLRLRLRNKKISLSAYLNRAERFRILIEKRNLIYNELVSANMAIIAAKINKKNFRVNIEPL